ncbi:MAG: dihydrofolate reductase family protein, partial [Deltaproteobacteria bacterium]|nr:dihydrofolate reductase family protein [Deltaproteobacteria bacterium]
FLSQNVVHRVVMCVAPIIIGGKGKDLFSEVDARQLHRAMKLRERSIRTFGEDVVIEGNVR